VLNSLGLRGPNVTPKRAGEFRVLVLGETQVYGLGLADDELLTHVLEERLNEGTPGRYYRIINFGVRGFTLNQQLLLLQAQGVSLKPDHVIIFLYVYSLGQLDISKYYERVKHQDWYMLDLGDKPRGEILWKWRFIQLGRKSALIAYLHNLHKTWENRRAFVGKLLRGVRDAEIKQRLGYVKEQLARFQALAQSRGFGLSIAVIPLPEQLVRDYPKEQYQSALQEIATALDVTFLDLRPALRALYSRSGRLPVAPFDAHYDAAAHRAMAEELLDHFRSYGARPDDGAR
jgi:lysophospholipase L1-like esterase